MNFDHIRQQLEDNGLVINEREFVTDIVLKLPNLYSELVTTIEMDLDKTTLADLKDKLRAFYRRKILTKGEEETEALIAKMSIKDDSCSYCNKAGHHIDKCFTKKNREKKSKYCKYCKKKGHTTNECFKRGNKPSYKPNNNYQNSNSKPDDSPNINYQQVLMATSNSKNTDFDSWIVDTGCTNHVTGSRVMEAKWKLPILVILIALPQMAVHSLSKISLFLLL
mmetsp:Transcript_15875/g.22369  ORF Transcript_15875/g.22369 Transcript_15875/m.22369 type:complete len:223 (-) Transcript_15875:1722-2390(-)